MEVFYFTEKTYKFDGLDGVNMDHLETSIWFEKREQELRKSFTDSSGRSSSTNSFSLPNSRISKFRLESTKKGKALINLSTVDGIVYIRVLWKEDAWLEYCSIQVDGHKESLNKTGSISLDYWNEEVTSFNYKKLTGAAKKEIIEQYFMDFFKD